MFTAEIMQVSREKEFFRMQQSLFGSLLTAQDESPTVSLSSLLDQSLQEAVFTVIDCETTGLSAKKNALTEVTAIQYKNGQEIAKYSTLVKPTEPISEEVELLTGITNEMVAQSPALITVMTDLCSFIGPQPIIVGHNVAFDIRFLQEKLHQSGLSNFVDRLDISTAFCTRALALKALPGLPSYEGIVVATQCGIQNPNPHRAENDVRMAAGILFALITRLQGQQPELKTLQHLLDYQGVLSL
jgi:DNA polymerase III epsilon subunit family exonuclease